jgi:hypothetical protein
VYLSIEIYGENRFNRTYDPCNDEVDSLCPITVDKPIETFVVFPVESSDVAGIPSIAIGIPDLEGFARLQIFSNATQTQIGCFQAVMTNGHSLSQPEYVGSILGALVFLAVMASFITAIYGIRVTSMRMHYAHSLSVLVIFETLHSIFFSGALSVNWPSVLPAWWSNFAWTAGLFASNDMVRSLSSFTGNNGNVSQVGGAGSTTLNNNGGLLSQIYGLSPAEERMMSLMRRADDPYEYTWGGKPRIPGMPMPGTWPGLAGTLSAAGIPPAEAFTLSIIWLMVILGAVVVFIVATKFLIDFLVKTKLLKTDGFDFFRSNLLGYVAAGVLRTLYIAFFAMMTLAMYQFALGGPAGPLAIAAIVWIILFVGLGGLAVFAWYTRFKNGKFEVCPDTIRVEKGKLFKKVPFVAMTRSSKIKDDASEEPATKPYLFTTLPFKQIKHTPNDPNQLTVHQDEAYIKRFGWLSARYRRTRWWFFTLYLGYQFVRACFIGAGARNPLAQVFGLFIFEVLALVIIVKLTPFEGTRNSTLAIWMLSISKIITTGLSIAFLPDFNVGRIGATVVGLIIVVVQGFLAVAVVVFILIGIFSSWASVSRNREEFNKYLDPIRITYYEQMAFRAKDIPRKQWDMEEKVDQGPQTFDVKDVRRAPKIEDEELDQFPAFDPGVATIANKRHSRANSVSSHYSTSSLPRAARVHRASWSSKDFAQWDAETSRADHQRLSRARSNSLRMQAARHSGMATPPPRRPMTPTREQTEENILTIKTDVANSPVGFHTSPEEMPSAKEKENGVIVEEKQTAALPSPTTLNTNELGAKER